MMPFQMAWQENHVLGQASTLARAPPTCPQAQPHPAVKPKGQWEELNLTVTWGWEQVIHASAKVQKKNRGRGVVVMANRCTQHKHDTEFLPGIRGHGLQVPGVKPLPWCSHSCQCQPGSSRKWEPSGPGIPGTQLWLDGTTGDLTSLISTKPVGPFRLHLLP